MRPELQLVLQTVSTINCNEFREPRSLFLEILTTVNWNCHFLDLNNMSNSVQTIFHGLGIDEATDTITDYIKFCVDCVATKKVMYQPGKKWLLGIMTGWVVKGGKKETQGCHRTACCFYGLYKTLGLHKSCYQHDNTKCLITCDELSKANKLNDFFLRFDTQNFSLECNNVLQSITTADPCSGLVVNPLKIQSLFSHVCKTKSAGLDVISAFLLKTFAAELTPAWCPVFQRSADSYLVPALWKKSTIIPIPKKLCPTENNDYRPVALTSVVMKCFGKYMVSMGGVQTIAINSITHLTLKHLEDPKAYARLLLIDFSSAFN
ncbi:hypothetical protein N1851_008575 [Merluccius polli]|nr:hypothetical protein N1851_008575 [Merluccius polli]